MSNDGPSTPDFTWGQSPSAPPPQPGSVPPVEAAPPAAPRPPRRRRTLIIAIIVALVVALAAVGWFGIRPALGRFPGAAGTPLVNGQDSDLQAARPGATTFTPKTDVGTPERVRVLGAWSGVAVLSLDFPVAGVADPEEARSVLMGVATTTGDVLWSLATLPDGGTFTVDSFAADKTKIALALTKNLSEEELAAGTKAVTEVMAVTLNTGALLGRTLLISNAEEDGVPVKHVTGQHVFAYEDGIVVLAVYSRTPPDTDERFVRTEAYVDTDFTEVAWSTTNSVGTTLQNAGDVALPNGFVLASSNNYVDIKTGKETRVTNVGARFHTDGSSTIKLTVKFMSSRISGMESWDMTTNKPLWNASFDADVTEDAKVCITPSAAIVVDVYLRSATSESRVMAYDMSDGSDSWSMTSDELAAPTCTAFATEEVDVLALPYATSSGGSEQRFINATSQAQLGSMEVDAVYPCGGKLICGVHQSERGSLTVAKMEPEGVTPLWMTQANILPGFDEGTYAIFPAGHGALAVAEYDGKYAFFSFQG